MLGLRTKSWTVEVRNGVRMAYSRRMVERARALRGAGLTVMEITEILGGPGKTSVWRWIRDVRKPAQRPLFGKPSRTPLPCRCA